MSEDRVIAGIDEAGRGPLAGPVFAAAVILDHNNPIPGLRDSKKLTAKQRQRTEQAIKNRAISWSVASASVDEIDAINILQATLLAMTRAVEGLDRVPEMVRVDGNRIPAQLPCPAIAVVGGDNLHADIAAASILAKEARDRDMIALAGAFPEYGFECHKGYPTKRHLAALQKYGASRHHRKSFSPIRQWLISR